MQGHIHLRNTEQRITHANALVRGKEEELVLHDRSAEGRPEAVVAQGWNRRCTGDHGVQPVKERTRVPDAVLEIFIELSVVLIGSGEGDDADVGAAAGALRSVVHRSIYPQFLNRLLGGRRQRLSDRTVNRCAGGDFSCSVVEILSCIQNVAVRADLAGALSVEEIVSTDGVQGKAVTRVTLAIRPDGKVAQSGVAARPADQVGIHAWAEDGELGKAAGSQRNILKHRIAK